ncbi:excinuclease ABC subunit UvrA [Raineya orbicola]|jgi:excinuclease ABC subunit A|uniref:UvrABC system protein A n=1 Tax=Raineya orbicola TaxID=2016530 RepID=A0A2N3IAR3_9BACT|nr:excinuclease ABC subunit UvrA [Raineya orbicola]PKQ67421.1 uvra: excinuclease ABC subunit A [Raineya orbicola]
MEEQIEIYGAREHNLKNFDLTIPRQKLVVVTGVSGSGKSSLVFDTIFAEAQRRYMESFSAYARGFIGEMQRPDVDKIEGLSPVIAIEQKTTSKNPRSTVGTLTEIYDFLRLLFARAGEAYSYVTGEKMIQQSPDQIRESILQTYANQKISILAPLVKGRKGHYKELFAEIAKKGYLKARIDGKIQEISPKLELDRYKIHDIEVLIDRLQVRDDFRLADTIQKALKEGKGTLMVLDEKEQIRFYSKFYTCPTSGISYDEPAPNTFSFNSPYGWCPTCEGLGVIENFTEDSIIPNKNLSIEKGAIAPLGEFRDIWIFKKIESILKKHKISIKKPIAEIPREVLDIILYGSKETIQVASTKYPGTDWHTTFEGIVPFIQKMMRESSESVREYYSEFLSSSICPECNGARLKKEALHFKIDNKNIAELSAMSIAELAQWLLGLENRMQGIKKRIAEEVLKEIRKRLQFLIDVGLDYLTLNRAVKTLSGGESQRIRLATQIGTQLTGVLYVLDEPSIGLHQRDNQKLIQSLQNLRDIGNSVIVVEHDKDMMLQADYIIDIGPEAGRHGGAIVGKGSPQVFLQNPNSLTAQYLKGIAQIKVPEQRRAGNGKFLLLKGCRGHNLKNITLTLPLGKMIAVTGVSGSGKSSLIHHTLFPILNRHFYNAKKEPLPYEGIEGLEHLDKVIEIDQSPIGRTPRSNTATYTGVFTDIRDLFAQLPEAKIRGYKPGRFSFNVKGGRCETCEGAGVVTIEMEFLPDVHIPCRDCKGKRYNRETLEVRFKGKSIADVLDMTIEQALEFFENQPRILSKIKTIHEVGLGYITLGQPATTLSGGEAQRVKLATELSRKDTGKTLYILDEPTTGLHFQDIEKLLLFLNKLVEKGNTVLIIEHNLDVIKVCDHIIDLGLEGGEAGGYIIAEGSPEELATHPQSYTGKFLKMEL